MSGDEDFLSRWSRRKRSGPEPEEETPAPEDMVQETGARPAPPAEDEDEAAVLERLGLPDPDTLEQGADFSVFMRAAVPEAIRRRALRRLWRSNPALAVLDGLNDYDDDFSGGFVKPGTLKTAYEVGRGIVNRALEAEDTDGEDPALEPPAPGGATDDPSSPAPAPVASSLRAPVEPRPPAPPEPVEETDEIDQDFAQEDPEDDAPSAPVSARRRMAFRFEDPE